MPRLLAICTLGILAFCLVAAMNSRAAYSAISQTFEYRESYVSWLPHSYDAARTWRAVAQYVPLAGFFWGLMDWLRPANAGAAKGQGLGRSTVPGRMRTLLWILAIQGALVSLEGILQRADGGGKLLWLVEPRVNPDAVSQFGPFAYRSNAAQYLNLIWPTTLALWLWMSRASRRVDQAGSQHHLLLPLAALTAIGPLVSLSRAGVLVALAQAAVCSVVVMAAGGRRHWRRSVAIAGAGVILAGGAFLVNGTDLIKRFGSSARDFSEGRQETYLLARRMADDFPVYGTGPGTFESVFSLYRNQLDDYWPSQLHNDWLETRITFGWVGTGIILLALTVVCLRWFLPGGGASCPWAVWASIGVGLAGCLAHARVDFPFQIHSILTLFLTLCAILSALHRPLKG